MSWYEIISLYVEGSYDFLYISFLSFYNRLCLIHEAEVKWVKQPMVVCMRFFNKTMDLSAQPPLKQHERTSLSAVPVMLLQVFYSSPKTDTTEISSSTSMFPILRFPYDLFTCAMEKKNQKLSWTFHEDNTTILPCVIC